MNFKNMKWLAVLFLVGFIPFLILLNAHQEPIAPKPPIPCLPTQTESIPNIPHISDIHFNPFYDATLVENLIKSNAEQWESIFQTSKINTLGTLNESETNYLLLISALNNLSEAANKPDFVIFTGDFLAHDFDEKFANYSKPGDNYSDFVIKTMNFMTLMFKKFFPDTPVYFCLGNNDSDTGDYEIVPDGTFLKGTTPILSANMIKDDDDRKTFEATYPAGGYFILSPRGNENTRIISLNSNFFSVKYIAAPGTDPGTQELDWLEKTLASLQIENKKVWIILHIPPGANVYSTISKKSYVPMWMTKYNDHFITIMMKYRNIINAGFAGHTHMDDFRLLQQTTEPHGVTFFKIGPAISPEFGNNPAFEWLSYNRKEFSLGGYYVYYIDIASNNTPTSPWKFEYNFNKTYDQPYFTASSILTVYNSILANPTFKNSYMVYYNVSSKGDGSLNDSNFKAYWCGIGCWTEDDFTKCNGN